MKKVYLSKFHERMYLYFWKNDEVIVYDVYKNHIRYISCYNFDFLESDYLGWNFIYYAED